MIIIFVVLALSGVPWILALSKRFGLLIAVPGTAAAAILLVLSVLLVSRVAQLDIVISQVVGGLLFTAAGVLVVVRTPALSAGPVGTRSRCGFHPGSVRLAGLAPWSPHSSFPARRG
jgi:hypothetical protein